MFPVPVFPPGNVESLCTTSGTSGAERLHEMVSEYRIFADSVQSFLSSCNFSVEEGQDHD